MLTRKFYTFLCLVILMTATMGVSATRAHAHSHAMLHDALATDELHASAYVQHDGELHLD